MESDVGLIGGPGVRAFADQDFQAGHQTPTLAQPPVLGGGGEQAVQVERHIFRRGVDALEQRIVVQVGLIHRVQRLAQFHLGQADIDQQ